MTEETKILSVTEDDFCGAINELYNYKNLLVEQEEISEKVGSKAEVARWHTKIASLDNNIAYLTAIWQKGE